MPPGAVEVLDRTITSSGFSQYSVFAFLVSAASVARVQLAFWGQLAQHSGLAYAPLHTSPQAFSPRLHSPAAL